MTREEAINLLDLQLHGSPEQIEQHGSYDHATAIKMAIEALKTQPCDAVSREAAITALTDLSNNYVDKGKEYHPHIDFVIHAIKSLPSVQPERPKGEWITYNYGLVQSNYRCSNCNAVEGYKSDFCPNCGADMQQPIDKN